jgi:hypothetical protein
MEREMTKAAVLHSDANFKWSRSAAPDVYQAPEAFLCILSLAATVDCGMATLESEWLQQITRRWWERGVVRERDVEALNSAVCARLAKGAEATLAEAAAALPTSCRAPVFAQALDLMLLNGPLHPQEDVFAQDLAHALGIEDDDARRMRACLAIKNAF